MRRFFTALLIAGLPVVAAAYPSELRMEVGDLDITGTLYADGPVAAVRVTNHENVPVRCSAVFRNGPEQGRARRAIIESGDMAIMSWSPRREVVRLEVVVSCEREAPAADGED
ncbi:hypothetical protein [Wenzhouxiangella sp. XN24]|uniref:hypothetical protein n=1 Tax=Wenzhouxiangella sp. XN24 TaxID=2713569 RepID=UPI0013ED20BC|nr:hypothetical protein [Wenzhouxiangella sp. XN24]NGX17637.1 hypothetical protein [Wenzhouxiangella sp. XN24]